MTQITKKHQKTTNKTFCLQNRTDNHSTRQNEDTKLLVSSRPPRVPPAPYLPGLPSWSCREKWDMWERRFSVNDQQNESESKVASHRTQHIAETAQHTETQHNTTQHVTTPYGQHGRQTQTQTRNGHWEHGTKGQNVQNEWKRKEPRGMEKEGKKERNGGTDDRKRAKKRREMVLSFVQRLILNATPLAPPSSSIHRPPLPPFYALTLL